MTLAEGFGFASCILLAMLVGWLQGIHGRLGGMDKRLDVQSRMLGHIWRALQHLPTRQRIPGPPRVPSLELGAPDDTDPDLETGPHPPAYPPAAARPHGYTRNDTRPMTTAEMVDALDIAANLPSTRPPSGELSAVTPPKVPPGAGRYRR